jgi:protein-S-isoprenylcysteine O-methyltransferase Ste14
MRIGRPGAIMKRIRAAVGSTVFFLLAPGVVAGLIPWWITGWRGSTSVAALPFAAGVVISTLGLAALVHGFQRFVREGAGTPAPVAPTERLVVGGLYRHVRNPMYLAVVSVIAGQALLFGSVSLAAYGLLVLAAMVAFARGYEEPALARRFGPEYEAYRRAVPGWWPRLRPWGGAR